MKVWIDLSAPPHVNFFRPLIKRLDQAVVTARDFGSVRGSLQRLGIDYTLIGSHGLSKKEKLLESSERIKELTEFISEVNPDVGLSKHSVECSRVCFGLGIPSISVLDHETAEIQNRLIIPLSDVILTPSFVSKDHLKKFGARKIVQFYGVCEYVNQIDFEPSERVLGELGLSKDSPIIVSRSEPYLSSHVYHKSNLFRILQDVLDANSNVQVVFLPRNRRDRKRFGRLGVIIPKKVIDTLSLYKFADLMIGAGCCMNREACLAGCPAISIYPDELPAVDKFLIKNGLMKHTLDERQAVEWCLEYLEGEGVGRSKLEEIIGKFEDPHELILREIKSLVDP